MIAAYAADVQADELTIVELGAGHGRFGFLCARHLAEMAAAGTLPLKRWKYILTDVADRNIDYWRQHEALRPLVEQGVLDFARFEAGVDTEIQLRESGATLGIANPTEQLVVIGNYFFDSLPIDVWQVEEGTLYDCRPILSLAQDAPYTDKKDAAILEHLEVDWERTAVTKAGYLQADLNSLVDRFRSKFRNATFTLPVGGIDTLTTIERWSMNGYLLLTADKGYTREADLDGRPLPTMVQHGCFSFSVNFCALGRWFEQQGGAAWLPQYRDGSLEFTAFCSRRSTAEVRRLNFEFAESASAFTPGDYHQVTRRCERTMPDLRNCLSLVRLSCYEPQVFYHLRRAIRAQLEGIGDADREAVRDVLERTAERYFHLDDQDVPFAIGLIYQQLGDYAAAVPYYRQSLRLFGEDATALCNLATCLTRLGNLQEAYGHVGRAVEMDPEFAEAIQLKQALEADPRLQLSPVTH
jgi:hypothetical protein